MVWTSCFFSSLQNMTYCKWTFLLPSFENLTAGYPKVNNFEQNTRKHKEHWFIPGDAWYKRSSPQIQCLKCYPASPNDISLVNIEFTMKILIDFLKITLQILVIKIEEVFLEFDPLTNFKWSLACKLKTWIRLFRLLLARRIIIWHSQRNCGIFYILSYAKISWWSSCKCHIASHLHLPQQIPSLIARDHSGTNLLFFSFFQTWPLYWSTPRTQNNGGFNKLRGTCGEKQH